MPEPHPGTRTRFSEGDSPSNRYWTIRSATSSGVANSSIATLIAAEKRKLAQTDSDPGKELCSRRIISTDTMSLGNHTWRDAPSEFVNHDQVSTLFPVDHLPEEALTRNRDAFLLLEELDSSKVVGISPTGLASSYSLRQRPLTVIDVKELPPVKQEIVSEACGQSSENLYVLLGSGGGYQDHSLSEFD